MKCSCHFLILVLLITVFVVLIIHYLVYGFHEGMDVLESNKNYLTNNISTTQDLAGRIETLKDQQPPTAQPGLPMAVVTMDSVMSDVYKPIQVTCTIQDCSMVDSVMKQGVNVSAGNYFNDGYRDCDANKCSKLQELHQTMTQMDPSGAYFKDDKGSVYDFLGNMVNART